MLGSFGVLLLGATIGLHIEDARGVSAIDLKAVADALGTAIHKRTGEAPVLDLLPATGCKGKDRCLPIIRERTGAKDVIFLNLLGAPSRIRMLADRVGGDGEIKAQADLTRDASSWSSTLDGVALILFPEAQTPPPKVAAAEPPPDKPAEPPKVAAAEPPPDKPAEPPKVAPPVAEPAKPAAEPEPVAAAPPTPAAAPAEAVTAPVPPEKAFNVWPWAVIGGGAASGVVGIVLGAGAKSARTKLETTLTLPAEQPGLRSTAVNGAIAADILFGVAALAIGGGVAWLLLE